MYCLISLIITEPHGYISYFLGHTQSRRIDDAAYAARMKAEEEAITAKRRAEKIEREAQRQRELLTTRLSRQRRLRKAEKELYVAQLIASMTNVGDSNPQLSIPPAVNREAAPGDKAPLRTPSPTTDGASKFGPPILTPQVSLPTDVFLQPSFTPPVTISTSGGLTPFNPTGAVTMSPATDSGLSRQSVTATPRENTSITWSSPTMYPSATLHSGPFTPPAVTISTTGGLTPSNPFRAVTLSPATDDGGLSRQPVATAPKENMSTSWSSPSMYPSAAQQCSFTPALQQPVYYLLIHPVQLHIRQPCHPPYYKHPSHRDFPPCHQQCLT